MWSNVAGAIIMAYWIGTGSRAGVTTMTYWFGVTPNVRAELCG